MFVHTAFLLCGAEMVELYHCPFSRTILLSDLIPTSEATLELLPINLYVCVNLLAAQGLQMASVFFLQ